MNIFFIYGYPFENNINFGEIFNLLKSVDRRSNKELLIHLRCQHFEPTLLTPMENEQFNFNDYRSEILKEKYRYIGNSIKILTLRESSSNVLAFEQLIFRRASENDLPNILKYLCNKKYNNLNNTQKMKLLKDIFGHIGSKQNNLIQYLERSSDLTIHKQQYFEASVKYNEN